MSERTPEEWLDDVYDSAFQDGVAVSDGYPIGDQSDALLAALAAWQSDRARLATLEARVAALVPLAEYGWPRYAEKWGSDDATLSAARAALAAIAAETTTTGGQR